MDNTKFKLTCGEDCYIGTLYFKDKDGLMPVLVTAGATTKNERRYVWGY